MYIKNSNFAIYLGLALIVGFGLSFAFTSLSDSSMMSGDISKAKNYSAMMEDPEESLLDEKLANDSEFYKATKTTMDILEERMSTLQTLTEKTDSVCAGIEEFEPVIKSINSLHAKSYNTNIAVKAASEAMKGALEGKRTNFEKASTDAYIGYMKITNQLSTGKVFVDKAAEYVEGKDSTECEDIVALAEAWSVYCILDAALNGREDEADYWRSKADEFSSVSTLGEYIKLAVNGGPLSDQIRASFGTGPLSDQIRASFGTGPLSDQIRATVGNGPLSDQIRATVGNGPLSDHISVGKPGFEY